MPQSVAAPSGRQTAWLGTGLLIVVGVVLYQMTSLVLAPASNRQISLSLHAAGHAPTLLLSAASGPSLDGVLAVLYLREAPEPAANQPRHPRRTSGVRSSSATRPAPPAPVSVPTVTPVSVPTVTPVETPKVPRVDPKQDTHDGGDGNAGHRRERD